MNIAFLHQTMPGQFLHLARWYGQRPEHRAVFLTRRPDAGLPGVRTVAYDLHRERDPRLHAYLIEPEIAILHGQAVVRALQGLARDGFVPDVVVGHSGWGETLFVKELLPDTRLLAYSEYYHRNRDSDVDFEPGPPRSLDNRLRTQMQNSVFLQALVHCDRAWTPTRWQRDIHPPELRSRIEVIHEGVDAARMCPDPRAGLVLPDGHLLTAADEVVTYVARNLEPCRGFPSFIRALPRLLERRPKARVVVVGSEAQGYGPPPPDGGTWRDRMLAEVPFDRSRVHFLGPVDYETFRRVLQVSSAHVYLTYPFVLSWSMLEAMACGCLVIGSATPPVQEVIAHGGNGLLVDFFKPGEIAETVAAALADPGAFAPLRRAARETVLERFELNRCLARQRALIEG